MGLSIGNAVVNFDVGFGDGLFVVGFNVFGL